MTEDTAAGSGIVVLVRDLMFASRIRAAAEDLKVAVQMLRRPEDAEQHPGRLLIVDLNQEGAIAAAQRWKAAHHGSVVGFVSHTDTPTITAARQAGVDRVVARGTFVQNLPELLGGQNPHANPLPEHRARE